MTAFLSSLIGLYKILISELSFEISLLALKQCIVFAWLQLDEMRFAPACQSPAIMHLLGFASFHAVDPPYCFGLVIAPHLSVDQGIQ